MKNSLQRILEGEEPRAVILEEDEVRQGNPSEEGGDAESEIWWEVGIDKGAAEGTITLDRAVTKEEAKGLAAKYLNDEMYKDYGVFIDEWEDDAGTSMPTGEAEVLRKHVDERE